MRKGLFFSFIERSVKRLSSVRTQKSKDKTSRKRDIPVLKLETRGNIRAFAFAGFTVSRQAVSGTVQKIKKKEA